MRRLKAAAGMVLLCLLCFFCTCGGFSAQTCAERAQRMVGRWDKAALNLYRYSGREIEYDGHDGYMLVMTPEAGLFPCEEALLEYQQPGTVRQCVAAVYPELSECFATAEAEVDIIIAVCDGDGKPLFTFFNGEPLQ